MRARLAAAVTVLVTALLLAACGGGTGTGGGNGHGSGTGTGNGGGASAAGSGSGSGTGSGAGSGSASTTGYAVTIHIGTRTERFDTAKLGTLPSVTVDTPASDGATQQAGPTLASVLGAAGVTTYTKLHVVGPSESLDLTPADVTPQLVLAQTKRGTVKLAGPGVEPSKWVRDVTDVEVTG
ncbi:hypothetical protein GCM10009836_47310 [Pseudonocardia ailaonensis]|uniref:Uncharacterized protein n=1 Tax=Pseudonocardia ailaonensis TaxID=367279 RepID=A0ABN2NCK7_9PSEU